MLRFYTKDPDALLQKFKAKLKAKPGQDSIQTWEQVGDEFGHTAERWKGKLSFESSINIAAQRSYLGFRVASMKRGTKEERQIIFAYFHGHLLQTFIDNLNDHFTAAGYADRRKK